MKNFTRNFLLGEHSIVRFLRKIGLSLVVLCFAFAAFADDPPEAQSTYEVWAENVSTCYQDDNTYEVKVSMKDFIAIHEFSLKLNFNNTDFTFDGVTGLHTQLQAGWQAPVVSGGTVTFKWVTPTTPVTFGDNVRTDVFTMKFKVNGYQHFYTGIPPTPFVSSLTWNGADSYYKNLPNQADIKTFKKEPGSLTVKEEWNDITVDITAADCFGGNVVATVTSPANVAGMQYSWNGNTFTNNASTNIPYPAYDQSVKVRNTASPGCVSYIKLFDVTEGPAPVTFTTDPVVEVNCPGGNGDIEIFASGGTQPYTYYVVPENMWGLFIDQLWWGNNQQIVNSFKSSVSVSQKPEGRYYVAVQDANNCDVLYPWSGGDYMQNWTIVDVQDNLDAFGGTITSSNPSCYTSSNGMISIQNITGGTAFTGGYDIYVNNVWVARGTSYSSMTRPAGTYSILVRDANGCSWSPDPIVLTQPQRINFTVDWADTGCTQEVGELWIDDVVSGDEGYDYLMWQYSTDITFQQNVSEEFDIDEVATGLAAGIYYVRIISYKMVGNQPLACEHRWQNAQGDDAVKVLDTEFDIVVVAPKCVGDQAKVTVSLKSGSGNHEFEYYMKNGENDNGNGEYEGPFSTTEVPGVFWVGPFEPGTWNTVYFYAKDLTADCEYELSASIYQPTEINAYIIPYLTTPPTCPTEADGNLAIQVSGGTPFANGQYEAKIDNGQWNKVNSTFSYGLDNKWHKIYIRDANMCETELWFDLPDFQNKISFVDEIWLSCPTDKVNLFNGFPEECDESVFGFCVEGIDMDLAYFNIWESQWHGIPLEHFFEDAWKPMYLGLVVEYLNSLGFVDFDVDEMIDIINSWGSFEDLEGLFAELGIESYANFDEITIDNLQEILTNANILYRYWTSDKGWKTVVTQGVEFLRNPMLHWRAQGSTDWQLLTHTTSFGPGVYEVIAWDEFGCKSNIETIHVKLTQGPIFLTNNTKTEPAGCFGEIDGKIIIDASRNIYVPNTSIYDLQVPIPGTPFGNPVIQYSIVAEGSQAIFNQPNWWTQLSWLPMDDYNHTHVAKQGSYWVVIRDYCATLDPTLIVRQLVTVEGKDELEVVGTTVTTNVTCNIDGYTPSNDGTVQIGTVAGGYGGYTYHLIGTTRTNNTGYFNGLAAGNYSVTITDAQGCSIVTSFTITQTAPFKLETQVAYPSCNDVFDGFIRYFVYGGTAPFQEVTNNFTAQERLNPNSIPENRWVNVTTSGTNAVAVMPDGHDFYAFDRRVRAGNYEIYLRDANGCIYGPVDVEVKQPAKIGAIISQSDVSCWTDPDNVAGQISNGSITVTPNGGWNLVDGFNYYIKLFRGATQVGPTVVQDIATPYTFTGLTTGTYRVEIEEYNPNIMLDGLKARPWITYPDYFMRWHEYENWLPYQNPSAQFSCPIFTEEVPVGIEDPIDYDITFVPVNCYNSATGSIEITNVTGGVGPYWFAISGPDGSGYETEISAEGYTGWRPANAVGAYSYTWTGLIHGFYNIYIRDSRGCTIFRESGEVNNRPELVMNMLLIDNANCNDGLGEFVIEATGGTGEYEYAVIEATFFQPGYTPTASMWQSSATFNKPAGVWIGWVRDAQFPTCITGAATTSSGAVIQPHRVVILEPTPVVVDQPTSGFEGRTTCYETTDGKIFVKNLKGGNGNYRAVVEGYPYDGTVVFNYTEANFSGLTKPVTGWNFTLGNLPPSTDKLWNAANITQADKYRVIFYDRTDCASEPVYVSVHRPAEFIIQLKTTQDVFVCHNDLAGLFEIVVVQGGTPFGFDGNNKGIYEYYWEAKDADGVVVHKGDWGFTPTFLGYGGFQYEVKARDAKGCQAYTEEYVAAPAPVVIEEIKDLTCFGNTTATARIEVSGETGRTFQVRYLRFAGETDYLPWSPWSASFDSIIVLTNLSYGDENEFEGHYKFEVRDDKGCISEVETMTFVPVQNQLRVFHNSVAGVCLSAVNLEILGGTAPYKVHYGDGQVVDVTKDADNKYFTTIYIGGGEQTITIEDYNECKLPYELTVPTEAFDVTVDVVTCAGVNEITLTVDGGFVGEAGYVVMIDGVETPGLSFTLENGTYELTILDMLGCSYVEELVLDVAPLEIMANVDCENMVEVVVMGGVEPYAVYLNDGEVALTSMTFTGPVGTHTVKVVDADNCEAEYTFTIENEPLMVDVAVVAGECTGVVTVTIEGGMEPFAVYLNDGEEALESLEFVGPAGTHTIKVVDAAGCEVTATLTIEATPVTRTASAHTNKGEEVLFVDAEAGISQMIGEGVHTFTYTTEEGCTRTLTVTVTASVKLATIAEVQGTSWESPVKGLIRGLTGTVTGIVPGVGYYIQDAIAPWSGIWVADPASFVLEGLGIYVEGTITEVNGITSIVGKGNVVNPPLAVTPLVVDSPEAAKNEMYESVLVTVKGARAKVAKPDGTWDVFTTDTNILTIGKWMFTYVPDAGDFYNVTGIVNGALDLFRLDPRKAADVVNLSKTTDVPVVDAIDFKVYPNPFNNELNIDNHDKLSRVTVTNIAGQRVLDVQYPERVIRTANLVSGVYIVTLFTEDGIVKSERIVKR